MNEKAACKAVFSRATGLGLEPRYSGPKPDVLPLDDPVSYVYRFERKRNNAAKPWLLAYHKVHFFSAFYTPHQTFGALYYSSMNILFGKRPKRLTPEEMRERVNLGSLRPEERADIEKIFHTALYGYDGIEKRSGISRDEFERGIKWLQDNPHKHSLEADDIKRVQSQFEKELRD